MNLSVDFREIWGDAVAVLRTPRPFFKKQKKGKSIRNAVIFYAVLAVVSLILSLVSVYVLSPALGYESFGPEVMQFIVVSQLIAFGLSFVWAYVVHLIFGIFKSKTNYAHAFRLYVYSRTPVYLLSWIPVIGALASLYSLYLLVIGTAELTGFKVKKSVVVIVIILIAMLTLGVLLGSLTTLIQ